MEELEKKKDDQGNWQENYTRMKMLIESLQSERDMFHKRLLLANMSKLVQPKVDEIEYDPMQN